MKTKFEEIVNVNAIGGVDTQALLADIQNGKQVDAHDLKVTTKNEVLALASAETISPAKNDKEQVLLLAIDFQNDFMEKGELGVPGSHKDIENTTRFIYNNMEKITKIAVSLDTHQPQQIFHPAWWVDDQGNHPAPFTIITAEDVENGKWRPTNKPKESLEYVQNLKKVGKKDLCIWTYHCLEGTFGAALEDQFANMVYFHSVARKNVTQRLVKGKDPLSEMYGIIKPEYSTRNMINLDFLNKLESYDKIVIVGEAKSHCVLESVKQILEHYQARPDITSKVFILEDCMSNIPGFEAQTEQTFEDFKKQYHVNITTSTDLVL